MEMISLIFSAVAILVSLISLWIGHFSPFRLRVTHDAPTFAVYKITPDISGGKSVWWIPSIDLSFTFYNNGQRPGEVSDVRIRMIMDDLDLKHTFYAHWVVNYPLFNAERTDRFNWIHQAVIKEWYPMMLSGNAQESVHVVLEGGRWDSRLHGSATLKLEIYSSEQNRWVEYAEYHHLIHEEMFNTKSTYTLADTKLQKIRE